MADQETNDTEFETYLEGKSPLSKLYQQSDASAPAKHIDDTILTAARQQAQRHIAGASSRVHRWYLPVALAASAVVVVVILRIFPIGTSTEPDQITDTNERALPNQHVGSGKASPEIMLEKINRLVVNGEEELAQQEFELFVELFPRYEIDFEQYPGIKKLKNSTR